MQKLRTPALAGEQVYVRGEDWIVLQSEPFDDCVLVTLGGAGDANLGESVRLLAPFDRIHRTAVPVTIAPSRRRMALRAAARAVGRAHGWLDAWTAATARIDLLPWQVEPALAAVGGATRILLADAVGLGKTIQAGLILSELRARSLIGRALVLTPASLRDQWAAELRDRFGIDPLVIDHAALTRLAAALPVGVNPWDTADVIVSSIDLVKRPEARAALDCVHVDALVIDEAHHLKPGTDRAAVGAELASRASWVVLATATPHSGDEQAYAFLLRLGALAGDQPMRIFRRSAAEAGGGPASGRTGRRTRFRAVSPPPIERAVLAETARYARAIWREHASDAQHAAILAGVICRRAASSPPALRATLERRRQLLAGDDGPQEWQDSLPWAEEEDEGRDDTEGDRVAGACPLADRAGELGQLDRLIALVGELGNVSSKALLVERLLKRTRESALIFSEYRDTVLWLAERIRGFTSAAVLHGGLSARERREAIQEFLGGRARVLLATDAAGEGLNLQARCRLVIDVELPWNPLRLEQRVGRVDRIGQSRRVHALHLFHSESFEDGVLACLERRMRRAEIDLSDPPGDAEVAAAAFEGRPLPFRPRRAPATSSAAKPSAVEHAAIRRLALRLAGREMPVRFARAGACSLQPVVGRLVRRVALVFAWDVHDAGGRLLSREVAPVAVDLHRSAHVVGKHARAFFEAVAGSAAVQRWIADTIDARTRKIRGETEQTAIALERRLTALLTGVTASPPDRFQGSLFDRRAEQRARANAAAAAELAGHVARRLAAIRRLPDLQAPSRARLAAGWPLE